MTTTAEWLAVPGYEGTYEVSDLGEVRSLDRVATNAAGVRRTLRSVVLSPAANPRGYLHVNLSGRSRDVHTLVLEAFVGPRPAGMECCHGDADPSNNALWNLRWDTPSANKLEIQAHGHHHLRNRTHCPREHALAAPNLVAWAAEAGHRQCLACSRGSAAIRNAAARGLPCPGTLQEVSDRYHAELLAAAS